MSRLKTPPPTPDAVTSTSTSTAEAIRIDASVRATHGLPPALDLMDTADVAALLHVTPRVVKNLRWTGGSTVGKLGWIKVGKKILFERSEVVRWLHEQRRCAGDGVSA